VFRNVQLVAVAACAVGLSAATARAECRAPFAPCVDAEPLWQNPSAGQLVTVADTRALEPGQISVTGSAMGRLRPAVLNVPSPSREGRDVDVVARSLAYGLTLRIGIGNRLELTALGGGLSQRGAGIKGVTSQVAPPIESPALRDARFGFGFALPMPQRFGAKLRFEAKLPVGSAEALAGEEGPVAAPSLAVSTSAGGWFGGLELGTRLRRPTEFFGARIGSQATVALGGGYTWRSLGLSAALEAYALPSLVAGGSNSYLPAEWLGSVRFAPRPSGPLSLGLSAGTGIPLTSDDAGAHLAFGVPSFRALLQLRFETDRSHR
jgi:hypothetical protein